MKEVKGKYNTAKVFTDVIEESAIKQIESMLSLSFIEGLKIRFMPDIHAGVGCVVGTTMEIKNKIVPSWIGVDISCGMETLVVSSKTRASRKFAPERLDRVIRETIPFGKSVRERPHAFSERVSLEALLCPSVNLEYAYRSLGTLGGGNHFIEANRDDENNLYFVIHSGSRHLGLEVAKWYQSLAAEKQNLADENQSTTEEKNSLDIPVHSRYLEGSLMEDYLHDMRILQNFASLSRKAMMADILEGMNIKEEEIQEQFTTTHNYIDMENMILRKGAVSARLGEKLIIPINMRDGSLICEGLGNLDWNCSAPHGAGRIMSRSKAFETLNMKEFKKAMKDIYTTSVNKDTLDESPMAYKRMDDIVSNIGDTVKISKHIKPVYNFKASSFEEDEYDVKNRKSKKEYKNIRKERQQQREVKRQSF